MKINVNPPRLFQPTERFDFANPPKDIPDIVAFAIDLYGLAQKQLALGIAANQVGLSHSIFAMVGDPEGFVCINPKIVATFSEAVELEETSLSYPGLVFEKSRSKHIRMRFQGPNGESFTKVFTGFTSRIAQQMVDHLEGRPFWDGVSRLKFDMAIRKARKLGFDYEHLPFRVKPAVTEAVVEVTKPSLIIPQTDKLVYRFE